MGRAVRESEGSLSRKRVITRLVAGGTTLLTEAAGEHKHGQWLGEWWPNGMK